MVEDPLPPQRWRVWYGFFLTALILYVATANRGVQTQDSGWQQYRIVTGQIAHRHGLALCHPMQYYLGRLAIRIPGLEPALAITLVSAVAGALAVANLALLIFILTRRKTVTVIAAGALLLSHTFWQHATHTESYTLLAAFLSGEWLGLLLFVKTGRVRYLLLAAFFNGEGIATHLLAALTLPVNITLFIWVLAGRKYKVRLAVATVGWWLIGTLPYSTLVLSEALATGDLGRTLSSALFGGYGDQVLNLDFSGRGLALSLGYIVYNFPGLTVPLAIVGIFTIRNNSLLPRCLRWVFLAELIIYGVFVVRYTIPDQYTFFFPLYMLLAIFAGLGLAWIYTLPKLKYRTALLVLAAVTTAWTPLVYLGTSSFLRARGMFATLVGNKPYRDGYRSFFVPWGVGDNHGSQLAKALVELADEYSLIFVEDGMSRFVPRYEQALGRLPATVTILDVKPQLDRQTAGEYETFAKTRQRNNQAVILVPTNRDAPVWQVADTVWERLGDLYRLRSPHTP